MNDEGAKSRKRVFDPAANGWEPYVPSTGFGELVGPFWRREDDAGPRFGFIVAPKHLNRIGIAHGGMLMTFADQAMGLTAHRATGGKRHATIELGLQFVGAVHPGDFVEARAEVVRVTRAVIFMNAKMRVRERVVATASGIWKILGEG